MTACPLPYAAVRRRVVRHRRRALPRLHTRYATHRTPLYSPTAPIVLEHALLLPSDAEHSFWCDCVTGCMGVAAVTLCVLLFIPILFYGFTFSQTMPTL